MRRFPRFERPDVSRRGVHEGSRGRRRKGETVTLVALLLVAAARASHAQTGMLVPTSSGRPDPSVLSLREMTIDVGIARGYARVNVRQVFENHTSSIQEGTWRFALPPSGAVGDFAVWDGNVRIPGVILEKRRARAIYRNLTTQRIDPGLLQQGEEEDRSPDASGRAGERPSGGALFSVKVAPIPAWGTKRLEMQYQHEVPWVNGVGELRLPLRPREGEPTTAGRLDVRITLLDGALEPPVAGAFDLVRKGREATFSGTRVRMAQDIVLRFKPSGARSTLTTFRNPSGTLPDGLALAPWERPADIPPEKDGFFLLDYWPTTSAAPASSQARQAAGHKPLALAILFDTSLSHRWGGLEAAYGMLERVLGRLTPEDRFVLVPFDRVPAADPRGLQKATRPARDAALSFLRERPLGPGTDVRAGVAAAAGALAGAGSEARILLLTDGTSPAGNLNSARKGQPLFTVLTGEERPESYSVASDAVLGVSTATLASEESADETLFLRRLLEPAPPPSAHVKGPVHDELPFTVTGADPKLRDVYPVMTQPPTRGSLSGWIGRYQTPVASATLTLPSTLENVSVTGPFPEAALEARDLPRRWARARVDELLRRIELEGERAAWIEEIIELSRRYKFVTPYTAFLAAPRSLLRPRRIQPGDPVIRVEADAGIVAATALLPFGKRVEMRHRPGTNLWEGRFLVPEGLPDGRLGVRLVLRDVSGATIVETKYLVLDGTPPTIRPVLRGEAHAGHPYRVAARTDADVIFLSVRLGDGPPTPLRWDPQSKLATAELVLPPTAGGARELFFEATDGAGNHGFARTALEIR